MPLPFPTKMTDAEYKDLCTAGWQSEVVAILHAFGFRPAGAQRNPDGSSTPLFVKQGIHPHSHFSLEKTATVDNLFEAIHDAAARDEHQAIADRYHRFTDCFQAWQRRKNTHSIEARLEALESAMKASNQTDPLTH